MNYFFCSLEINILLEKSTFHPFPAPQKFSNAVTGQYYVSPSSGTAQPHGLCFDINLLQGLMAKTPGSGIWDKVISIPART